MRRVALIPILYILIMVLCGCDTRRYIYQDGWVTVEFAIDWDNLAKASKAGEVTPNGATVVFFPTSGLLDEPLFKVTNNTSDKTYLPIGTYNVIVFNETVNGHDYLQFTGTDSYDTFMAYWETTKVKAEYSRSGSDEMIVDTDDLLLVDRLEGFEITYANSDSQDVIYLEFEPKVINKTMTVTAHIQGMENVSKVNSSSLYVEGMSSGCYLWSGEPTEDKTTHLTEFSNRSYYDDSESDGTMSATFYTFGDAANESKADDDNIARISFALRDGTTHPDIETNISSQLNTSIDLAEINIVIGLAESDDDPAIVLPEVEDTESSTGLEAEVEGWGDNIIIDIY